jgi:site-specific recombinase XerC
MIYSTALGVGLREMEIAALNIGDVIHEDGRVRRRIELRVFKQSTDEPVDQYVIVPDALFYKLTKLIAWKRQRGESLAADAPLFVSRFGERIATRTIRHMFRVWQQRAGFDRPFNFHCLRHTALTNVVRRTGDIRIAQRLGRHKDINTTLIYTQPSDEDILRAMRDQQC